MRTDYSRGLVGGGDCVLGPVVEGCGIEVRSVRVDDRSCDRVDLDLIEQLDAAEGTPARIGRKSIR